MADPTAPATRRFGRFELRTRLGTGPGADVWLARDPREAREIVLRLPRLATPAARDGLPHWLTRARMATRLAHARLVPVLDAGLEGEQPYVVSAHVPGSTLARRLAQDGPFSCEDSIALIQDVLEALGALHGARVVHRRLSPDNVLIDDHGRAWVMDAQLAPPQAPGEDGNLGPIGGHAGYSAPEVVQGQSATPASDVFSAALLLVQMLTGQPLVDPADAAAADYRVTHEQLAVPAVLGAESDEALRAIVQRALTREPAQRTASATEFREELQSWSEGGGPDTAGVAEGAGGPLAPDDDPLQKLLRRMRNKSDFPALSDAVLRIQNLTSSDTESIGSITNEILKDVALTNRLLRLVNSAHFSRSGDGGVSTVSRAVSLVGLNGIRNLTLSLTLLERMRDKTHAALLREEFLRSLMAGCIGTELCPMAHEAEEAFIGSMFQNLGRMLAGYYFPEEARTIRGLLGGPTAQPGLPAMTEESASASVLGLGFEAFGIGVAKAWGLPDSVQRCIRKPVGLPSGAGTPEPGDRLRWLAFVANEVADLIVRTEPREFNAKLLQLLTRLQKVLAMKPPEARAAIEAARRRLIEMAQALSLTVPPGSPAARLLLSPDQTGADDPGAASLAHTLARNLAPVTSPENHTDALVERILRAGMVEITKALADDYRLNDIVRMAMESMLRALPLRYVVFSLRDARFDALTGRFGLGRGVERFVQYFEVPIKPPGTDLISMVCLRGADTLIADASEARIADRLPVWFTQHIRAPSFLVLPLHVQGKLMGMIYADMAVRGHHLMNEHNLALLRSLRDQAMQAVRRPV